LLSQQWDQILVEKDIVLAFQTKSFSKQTNKLLKRFIFKVHYAFKIIIFIYKYLLNITSLQKSLYLLFIVVA
jgi:hypothetical protein